MGYAGPVTMTWYDFAQPCADDLETLKEVHRNDYPATHDHAFRSLSMLSKLFVDSSLYAAYSLRPRKRVGRPARLIGAGRMLIDVAEVVIQHKFSAGWRFNKVDLHTRSIAFGPWAVPAGAFRNHL
jgi:hypothetical protein